MSEPNEFFNFATVLDAVGSRVEEVISHLFPQARRQAGCYRVGGITGERGDSLSISTKPNNAGSFFDHADHSCKGNAIGLWALSRNLSYQEAGKELAQFLGVSPETRLHAPKKRPAPKIQQAERTFQCGGRTIAILPLSTRSAQYALSRGIRAETLRAFRCVSTDTDIILPHFDEDDHLVLVKTWSCDGLKRIFTNDDPVPVLFGKHLVDPLKTGSTLIITEGHWDAMTWHQLGHPAVSIPSGVSNDDWIGEDWSFLNCFSQIFLDFDDDAPGREAEARVKVRLGYERCRSIRYRFKDANAALMADEEHILHEAFEHALTAPIDRIVNPAEQKSRVRERLNRTHMQGGTPFFLPQVQFEFRPHEITLWFGTTSHGKALPLDTLVPTPHGNRTMEALEKGDYVYGSDGRPTKIIATSDTFIGNDCYEIEFKDRLKVVADANHLWALDTHQSRMSRANRKKYTYTKKVNYRQDHKMNNGVVMTTEELFGSNLQISVGGKPRWNFTIPVAPAYEGLEADLVIPPYTLGAWLGDGTSANAHITNHPKDAEILDRIRDDGFHVQQCNQPFRNLIKGLSGKLRELNLINNKHIPEAYFNASKEQRMELLRGLMDTDGTISNGRQCEFCSVKEHFAHQVQRLANGLGIKASMNIGNATISGRVIGKKYRVQWTSTEPVFNLTRKLERLPKTVGQDAMNRTVVAVRKVSSVPTKCLVVEAEDHLFLCTESCLITHNSTILSNQLCHAAALGKMSMVASFEQATPMTIAGMLCQYTGDADIGSSSMFDAAYDDLTCKVLFFDSMLRANPEELIATMVLAHRQLGVEEFVVDNIMTLEVDRQDNTAQANVADKFRVFASQYPVHVHLVAHPRKPPPTETSRPPSISDVMGASEWGAMAHNAICVWRDVGKAQRLSEMRDENMDPVEIQAFDETNPDGKIFWRKQRDNGELPMVSYRFDKGTKRAWKNPEDLASYYTPSAPEAAVCPEDEPY